MLIAITGITGLLGRNLVLEIIKNNKNNLDQIKLILFGRDSASDNLKSRIEKILQEELTDYLDDDSFDQKKVYSWFASNVKSINYKLDVVGLDIADQDLSYLKSQQIDYFIHIAALTDFRGGEAVRAELDKINVGGTKNVLDLVSKLQVKNLGFVSSAYVCGMTTGVIPVDYINLNQDFRNYYEKTKLISEIAVRDFCEEQKLNLKVFRPSTISGRLIEKPMGSVSKIDVFYEWCAFFYRYKKKTLKKESCIADHLDVDLRFYHSDESGLNIVPADYVAKVVYYGCFGGDNQQTYYAVNNHETPHRLYTDLMLKSINITGVKHCEEMPQDLNRLEQLYYKTVGMIYTPYITMKPILFDNSNVRVLEQKHNFSCPPVDHDNFTALMDFVVQKDFDL